MEENTVESLGLISEELQELRAENARLCIALAECFDVAIPQAMPWTGTVEEKGDYASRMLADHLRGLVNLSRHEARRHESLRAAIEPLMPFAKEWAGTHGSDELLVFSMGSRGRPLRLGMLRKLVAAMEGRDG